MDSINGLDLCRMLRHQGNPVPVLIIGARGSANNCAFYLEAGSDDYLTKPFGMREFIARCRALMRRQRLGRLPEPRMLQYKSILCILKSAACWFAVGSEIFSKLSLTRTIYELSPAVWSRDQLLERIWGQDLSETAKQ